MKRLAFCLVFLCCGLFLLHASPSAGKTYKVIDKSGNVSYKEIGPPTTPRAAPDVRPAPSGRRGRSQVDIYITTWCGYCRKAMAFLDAQGIGYTAYDIEKDDAAAKRYSGLAGKSGVPFAVINGQKLSGFSESAWKRALGIR